MKYSIEIVALEHLIGPETCLNEACRGISVAYTHTPVLKKI